MYRILLAFFYLLASSAPVLAASLNVKVDTLGNYHATRGGAGSNDTLTLYGAATDRDSRISTWNAGSATASSVMRAADWLDTVGINVHLEYTDSDYAQVTKVKTLLDYVGIKHLRDATIWSSNQGQSSYGTIANGGYKFDMLFAGGHDLSSQISQLKTWMASHSGAVVALEGPNEINNGPFTDPATGNVCNTSNGANCQTWQTAFKTAIDADGTLGAIPVLNMTGTTAVTTGFDYGNIHPYATSGKGAASGILSNQYTHAEQGGFGDPWFITEYGWHTADQKTNGVSETAQAKLILQGIFTCTKLGFTRCYLYQLLDAYAESNPADPSTWNQEKHFGIAERGFVYKPSAEALHNAISLLTDTDANASAFSTTVLPYTVSNLPADGQSLMLEKTDGTYYLILWSEPVVWDATGKRVKVYNALDTTVNFTSGSSYDIELYDPFTSPDVISSQNGVKMLTLKLGDSPKIVKISPAS